MFVDLYLFTLLFLSWIILFSLFNQARALSMCTVALILLASDLNELDILVTIRSLDMPVPLEILILTVLTVYSFLNVFLHLIIN